MNKNILNPPNVACKVENLPLILLIWHLRVALHLQILFFTRAGLFCNACRARLVYCELLSVLWRFKLGTIIRYSVHSPEIVLVFNFVLCEFLSSLSRSSFAVTLLYICAMFPNCFGGNFCLLSCTWFYSAVTHPSVSPGKWRPRTIFFPITWKLLPKQRTIFFLSKPKMYHE